MEVGSLRGKRICKTNMASKPLGRGGHSLIPFPVERSIMKYSKKARSLFLTRKEKDSHLPPLFRSLLFQVCYRDLVRCFSPRPADLPCNVSISCKRNVGMIGVFLGSLARISPIQLGNFIMSHLEESPSIFSKEQQSRKREQQNARSWNPGGKHKISHPPNKKAVDRNQKKRKPRRTNSIPNPGNRTRGENNCKLVESCEGNSSSMISACCFNQKQKPKICLSFSLSCCRERVECCCRRPLAPGDLFFTIPSFPPCFFFFSCFPFLPKKNNECKKKKRQTSNAEMRV